MSNRKTRSWAVPLKGDVFDMEDLPLYLDGSQVTVAKREDKYFLLLPVEVVGDSYELVTESATSYLSLINGAASLLIDGYRPVSLEGGVFHGIDEQGNISQVVVPVSTAEIRCKLNGGTISINGELQPDHRTGSLNLFISNATGHQAKADALVLLSRSSPSWSELYLVYELVESNVGSRMFTDGWIGKAKAAQFTRTANSYTALGAAGRHGKDSGAPPAKIMEKHSAELLIRSLVASWFQETLETA